MHIKSVKKQMHKKNEVLDFLFYKPSENNKRIIAFCFETKLFKMW